MVNSTFLSLLPEAEVQALLNGPAGPPPPGQVPHFGASSAHLRASLVVYTVFEAIFYLIFVLRILVRLVISGKLMLEDWVIVLAAALHTGTDASSHWLFHKGIGKHMWDLKLGALLEVSKGTYPFSFLYLLALCAIKVAILLQFIRILAPKSGKSVAYHICRISIFVNIVFYLLNALLTIFRCVPIDAAWNVFKVGRCLRLDVLYISAGVFGLISDIFIIMVPIPIILKLNMSGRKKFGVLIVFATGLLAFTASILRLYYSYMAVEASDTSYYMFYLGFMCNIEMFAGMIVFCAPLFPQFWHILQRTFRRRRLPRSLSSSSGEVQAIIETPVQKASSRMPYEMPSLASFEQRELQQSGKPNTTSSTMTRLTPVHEVGWRN